MKTLEELQSHYKTVRNRINNAAPKKTVPQIIMIEPKPEPKPKLELKKTVVRTFLPVLRSQTQIIIDNVANRHNMTSKEIKGFKRKKKYVDARREAAYLLKLELNLSYPRIGFILGCRDHTTILHAVRIYILKNNLPPLTSSKEL